MEDTIAAVATAYGEGGIGIIRISGPKSRAILETVFRPKAAVITDRRLSYGHVFDSESSADIDEVLAVFMPGPATYTAEDVAEIHCHGGTAALRKTLDLVFRSGARPAERGEFTKRAFLNGRIDLSQAEAVIDMIRAKTDISFKTAFAQAEGKLSGRIREIRNELLELLIQIAVNIDYPDEDIEELTLEQTAYSLSQIGDMIENLLLTADTGRILKEGLRLAIVGKPNVGKSSLMNALLRESRAIVTEIPGTTRDTIEEEMNLRGIPIVLTDTAGIRSTDDRIEQLGIERSKDAFNKADLILLMLDGSKSVSEEDRMLLEHCRGRKVLLLVNKTDLEQKLDIEQLQYLFPDAECRFLSIKEGEGLEQLENYLENMVYCGKVSPETENVVTNARHKNLLEQALHAVKDAEAAAGHKEALEFVEVDTRRAWEFLGEILGETVADDIIEKVFERFCLGK